MHLAKHSLMAADLHKDCISIHCAPIKVNCNLFIISLNLIYCKMNSIYRCSNGCANHSSSHWTGLCFWDTAAVASDAKAPPQVSPKRWPCMLHPAQAQVMLYRWLWPASLVSPCPMEQPLRPTGTHPWSAEAAGILAGFLPWSALLDILAHHWSQGQGLLHQQPDATWAQSIQFGTIQR